MSEFVDRYSEYQTKVLEALQLLGSLLALHPFSFNVSLLRVLGFSCFETSFHRALMDLKLVM